MAAQLGGQPVIILKEGTERTRGRDAQRNNIAAAIAVADSVRSALGPRGMDKLLVDSLGDVVITNDGATILDEIDVQHPAAKMMVEVAKTQDSEVGDGTTTSVILAGELLKRAEKLLQQKIHPTVITEGFRKAADKAVEILDEMSIKSGIEDTEGLKNAAMTCMSSKIVSESKDMLADICIDSIKAVAEKGENGKWTADIEKVQIQKKKAKVLMIPASLKELSSIRKSSALECQKA